MSASKLFVESKRRRFNGMEDYLRRRREETTRALAQELAEYREAEVDSLWPGAGRAA